MSKSKISQHIHSVIHNATRYACLVFQPQIRLSDSRMIGVEALLRLDDPNFGLISPSEFIHVAEESGAIQKLGDWVFGEVARYANILNDLNISEEFHISANVSPLEFRDENLLLPKKWIDRIRHEDFPIGRIVLEITESAMVKNGINVAKQISEAKGVGIDVAIDDFGTGYSSLSYLKDFDVKYLKLDKSFIDDIVFSRKTGLVVKGVIDMAHTVGITVIAEGVESIDQHDILKEFGCDYGQGYLYSRPVGEQDFNRTLDLMSKGPVYVRP